MSIIAVASLVNLKITLSKLRINPTLIITIEKFEI